MKITKNTKYDLTILHNTIDEVRVSLTAKELDMLLDKLTTFYNENYKELNPDED